MADDAPKKPRLPTWLQWGFALLVLAACLFWVDLGGAFRAIAGLAPVYLVPILAAMLFDRVFMGLKWTILLRALDIEITVGRVVRSYFIGTMSSSVMQARIAGVLVRLHVISTETGHRREVYAAWIMETVIGVVSSCNLALVGAALLYPSWTPIVVVLLVAGNVFFRLTLHEGFHHRVLKTTGRFAPGVLHRLYESYAQFSKRKGALWRFAALTVLQQLYQIGFIWLIAIAMGLDVEPIVFGAVTAVHRLVHRLPITPGSWGVSELAAIALYGLVGITPEEAFAIAMLLRALQLVVTAPGLLFLLQRN